MMSNCALIALTAPSSGRRCSASTPCERAGRASRALGDPRQAPAHLDQRDGEHEHDDGGEHDAQEDQQVRVLMPPPNPSVSAFM